MHGKIVVTTPAERAALPRIAVLALTLVLLCAAPQVRAAEPAPDNATARYEIRFLTGMIAHHHMAVMMADLCETRASHPELLALCQEIKTTQMAEIEQMQAWLADWYGIAYEPEMTPGMMRQMEKMASLSGAEFEVAFLTSMIRHHWQAIIESRHCLRRAYHAELRALCHGIAETQREEILLMQEWLCAWYDICHYGPQGSHLH